MSSLKKIPLEEFIQTLISLHRKGVQFIDLNPENNEEQDIIFIGFEQSYLSKDSEFLQKNIEDKQQETNFQEIDFNELM